MSYTNTIFNQLLTFLPKYHFNAFVGQHSSDKYTKKLTAWNQFIALLYAQAAGKESLRDIQTGLSLHEEKWAHLGVKSVARSTLSYANNKRDYKVFEELFYENNVKTSYQVNLLHLIILSILSIQQQSNYAYQCLIGRNIQKQKGL